MTAAILALCICQTADGLRKTDQELLAAAIELRRNGDIDSLGKLIARAEADRARAKTKDDKKSAANKIAQLKKHEAAIRKESDGNVAERLRLSFPKLRTGDIGAIEDGKLYFAEILGPTTVRAKTAVLGYSKPMAIDRGDGVTVKIGGSDGVRYDVQLIDFSTKDMVDGQVVDAGGLFVVVGTTKPPDVVWQLRKLRMDEGM